MSYTKSGLGVCVVFLALLACKEDKGDTEAEAPAAPATPPQPAAQATSTATATAAPAATERKISFKFGEVPDIPSERSNPPQGAEWDQAQLVNTQGANARAERCSMRILREWLNIYCTGDVIGYEKMEDFGKLQVDYFEKISPGKYASFVIRLKKGKNPKIRVCRKTNRASLFVSWPPGVDKPKHVALGKGPVCDGSDWGVGYGKAGGSAAKGAIGNPSAEDDSQYEELGKAAKAACSGGNSDACIFLCGKSSC